MTMPLLFPVAERRPLVPRNQAPLIQGDRQSQIMSQYGGWRRRPSSGSPALPERYRGAYATVQTARLVDVRDHDIGARRGERQRDGASRPDYRSRHTALRHQRGPPYGIAHVDRDDEPRTAALD